MKLTNGAIKELKNLIHSEYGVVVTLEDAEKIGTKLVNIYAEVIMKPDIEVKHG